MEIIELVIFVVCGGIILYAQRVKHKKELAALAKESSERIQEYHTKLVKVCTEPNSIETAQIIHEVKFNVEAEKTLWMGKEVPYNPKGLWAQIKEGGGLN